MASQRQMKTLAKIARSFNGIRTIFSAESLGLQKYEESRATTAKLYISEAIANRFKKRMAGTVDSDSKSPTSVEDVVTMLHLASDKEEDSEILHKLLKRYQKQKPQREFHFGPILMRYYYSMGKPVEALKAFCDPAFETLFEDVASLKVLLTLLYKYNMHDELLDVFEVVKAKKSKEPDHLKTLSNVVLASCYQKGTAESYRVALDIVQNNKDNVTRRAIVLAAAMAMKQRDPNLALELLSTVEFTQNLSARNLKVLAYSALDRPEEAIRVIKRNLFRDVQTELVPEAIQALRESVYRIKDENQKDFIVPELKHLEADLKEKGYLIEENLDHYLLEPIKRSKPDQPSRTRRSSNRNGQDPDLD